VSTDPRPERPPRPRRRPTRKMPLVLAVLLMCVALLVGVIVGYSARGDAPPAELITQTRTVPVVTVTVPAEP
jgi:hypothetical protein